MKGSWCEHGRPEGEWCAKCAQKAVDEQKRAELYSGMIAGLCPHGIDPKRVRCMRCEPDDAKAAEIDRKPSECDISGHRFPVDGKCPGCGKDYAEIQRTCGAWTQAEPGWHDIEGYCLQCGRLESKCVCSVPLRANSELQERNSELHERIDYLERLVVRMWVDAHRQVSRGGNQEPLAGAWETWEIVSKILGVPVRLDKNPLDRVGVSESEAFEALFGLEMTPETWSVVRKEAIEALKKEGLD